MSYSYTYELHLPIPKIKQASHQRFTCACGSHRIPPAGAAKLKLSLQNIEETKSPGLINQLQTWQICIFYNLTFNVIYAIIKILLYVLHTQWKTNHSICKLLSGAFSPIDPAGYVKMIYFVKYYNEDCINNPSCNNKWKHLRVSYIMVVKIWVRSFGMYGDSQIKFRHTDSLRGEPVFRATTIPLCHQGCLVDVG